jgi:hypothetical protein
MTTTPTLTPPNTQPSQSSGQSITSSVKLYKPTDLTDIGWRWNSLEDLKNKKKVTCDFCGEVSTGGITRAKQHQMCVGGQVKGCLKTPDNVKKQLREADEKKKAAKAAMAGEVNENADDIADLQEISRIRSGKRPVELGSMPAAQKKTKGPLDALYYQKPEDTVAKGKQTSINDFDKEARGKVCQYIARFFYRNRIAFNVAHSKSFKMMVEAIGNCGPHLKPPSYHELRVPMLKEELRYTNEMLEDNRKEQAKYGCSIMADGWTDTKGRTLINFLVNSSAGTMFVKSVDASAYMKTGQKVYELLDSFVEEVGEKNVVQLVTDNGSNYVLAGKYYEFTIILFLIIFFKC